MNLLLINSPISSRMERSWSCSTLMQNFLQLNKCVITFLIAKNLKLQRKSKSCKNEEEGKKEKRKGERELDRKVFKACI